jgi:ubiquinone/menaquinone biosynthesis C-methylase UbiE
MYPAAYARWLLHPLRNVIAPPGRIIGRLQLSPSDRVLEIGCGPGFFSPAVAGVLTAGHLTLIDAQAPMLTMAQQRLAQRGVANATSIAGFAESLPFADAAFDAVFMVAVLGETADPAAAMMELARVLRPGGRFSSTELWGDPDQVSGAELDALAASAGLAKAETYGGLLMKTFNYRKPG